MPRIRLTAGDVSANAVLADTNTARAIRAALPISGTAATWGDEVYFEIPVDLEAENPSAVVSAGDLGYWPPGRALCIFFGPTPASFGNEIRPASPVSVFGRLEDDPTVFRRVPSGARVLVERVGDEPADDRVAVNGAMS